jgi:hypothetical protein
MSDFKILGFTSFSKLSPERKMSYLRDVGEQIPAICYPVREKGEFNGKYGTLTEMLCEAARRERDTEIRDFVRKTLFKATVYRPQAARESR